MQNVLGRVRRLTVIIGLAGTLAVLLTRGTRDAAGFLAGAAFSFVSLRSWIKLAETAGAGSTSTRSARSYGIFLALRYVLLAVGLYAIVKVLGITPVATIVGLLVSFAAVIVGILYESVTSK